MGWRDWLKEARIEIEYHGVRAVLEGLGTSPPRRFWECEDPRIRSYLDAVTSLCIIRDNLIEEPEPMFISNWAIEAGRIVARKVGAKIISEEPYKIIKPLPDIDPETGGVYTV